MDDLLQLVVHDVTQLIVQLSLGGQSVGKVHVHCILHVGGVERGGLILLRGQYISYNRAFIVLVYSRLSHQDGTIYLSIMMKVVVTGMLSQP